MTRANPGGLDELSSTLRQLRSDAGKLTLAQAAKQTGFSTAKVSRVERGENIPSPADVATFAKVYGADLETRRHLAQLAEDVKASNRRIVLARRPNRAAFQDRLRRIEKQSEQIREFAPIIIPGLLQTAEYIQAIWNTGGGSAKEGAAFVVNRLARQAILNNPDKRVTILTTEGALGWAAGSPAMMATQIDQIAAADEKPTVRIGVIPFGAPAQVFPVSSWTLYDERTAVPGVLATQVVLEAPDVAPYVEQFSQLESLAVFDGEARAILAKVADRYRSL